MSSPRQRAQGLQAASVSSGIKKQITLEALFKQRKVGRVTMSSQHGCTKGKSCLTNLSTLGDEGTDGCLDKKKSSGQHMPQL